VALPIAEAATARRSVLVDTSAIVLLAG